jgi:hypothetical protein
MRPVIRPLLAALTLLILTGCAGSDTVSTLTQRPTGVQDEVLSWSIDVQRPGPRHTVFFGVDIDEAQLMGWARTDRPYGTLLYVSLTAPDGTKQNASVRMPVTEARQIGENKEANTVQVAFLAAGEMLPSGFRRVPAERAFSFKPQPGTYELAVHLQVPPGGEKKALRGLRAVRAEVRSREGAPGVLTAWTEQPNQLPVKPKPFPLTVP